MRTHRARFTTCHQQIWWILMLLGILVAGCVPPPPQQKIENSLPGALFDNARPGQNTYHLTPSPRGAQPASGRAGTLLLGSYVDLSAPEGWLTGGANRFFATATPSGVPIENMTSTTPVEEWILCLETGKIQRQECVVTEKQFARVVITIDLPQSLNMGDFYWGFGAGELLSDSQDYDHTITLNIVQEKLGGAEIIEYSVLPKEKLTFENSLSGLKPIFQAYMATDRLRLGITKLPHGVQTREFASIQGGSRNDAPIALPGGTLGAFFEHVNPEVGSVFIQSGCFIPTPFGMGNGEDWLRASGGKTGTMYLFCRNVPADRYTTFMWDLANYTEPAIISLNGVTRLVSIDGQDTNNHGRISLRIENPNSGEATSFWAYADERIGVQIGATIFEVKIRFENRTIEKMTPDGTIVNNWTVNVPASVMITSRNP